MGIKGRLVEEPIGDQRRCCIFPLEEGSEFSDPHAKEGVGSRIELHLPAILELKLAGHRVVIGGIEGIVEPQVEADPNIQYLKPFTGVIQAMLGIDRGQANEILRSLLKRYNIVEVKAAHPEPFFDDQLCNTNRNTRLPRQAQRVEINVVVEQVKTARQFQLELRQGIGSRKGRGKGFIKIIAIHLLAREVQAVLHQSGRVQLIDCAEA